MVKTLKKAGLVTPSRERVKAELLDAISKGEIQYDVAMSERVLSERLGVSRTPVREVLQELAREGIIYIHPSRGAFLKRISAKELQDLYELRLNLECIAVYRTAKFGDHEALRSFQPVFEVSDDIGNEEFLFQEQKNSEAFHLEIFRAADNEMLLSIYEKMLLKVRMSRRMSRDHFTERFTQARREHKAILRAILRREAEEARNLMSDHLRTGFDLRMRVFLTIQEQPIFILENREPARAEP